MGPHLNTTVLLHLWCTHQYSHYSYSSVLSSCHDIYIFHSHTSLDLVLSREFVISRRYQQLSCPLRCFTSTQFAVFISRAVDVATLAVFTVEFLSRSLKNENTVQITWGHLDWRKPILGLGNKKCNSYIAFLACTLAAITVSSTAAYLSSCLIPKNKTSQSKLYRFHN